MNERMFYPPQAGKILLLLRVRNARFRVGELFYSGQKAGQAENKSWHQRNKYPILNIHNPPLYSELSRVFYCRFSEKEFEFSDDMKDAMAKAAPTGKVFGVTLT